MYFDIKIKLMGKRTIYYGPQTQKNIYITEQFFAGGAFWNNTELTDWIGLDRLNGLWRCAY